MGEAKTGGPIAGPLVFDCDGVLLDSNRLKTDSFRACLLDEGFSPSDVEAFAALQKRSFGLSRYRLFEMFFTEVLGRPAERPVVERMLAAFGDRCQAGYLQCAPTRGAMELLDRKKGEHPLYVVSGSDGAELREVFGKRGLDTYFREIHGSPTPKSQLLKELVGRMTPEQQLAAWFFGDAKADYQAAQAANVRFAFVAGYSTDREAMEALAAAEGFPVLETLEDAPRLGI